MKVAFARIGNVKTRYYAAGSGPNLLLVHGVGVAADSWVKNLGVLAGCRQVYAPDLVGCGFTDALLQDSRAPQEQMRDHLQRFADQMGMEQVSIVGSSLGAVIAVLFYFGCPDRVDKLVLVGGGPVFTPKEELVELYRSSYANGRRALASPTFDSCLARMRNIVDPVSCVPTALLLMQLTAYALPYAPKAYEQRMQGLMSVENAEEYDVSGRLDEIRCPTLVIQGDNDPRGRFEQVRSGTARIPNAVFVPFEQCGHLPHVEQVDRFNRLVGEFL